MKLNDLFEGFLLAAVFSASLLSISAMANQAHVVQVNGQPYHEGMVVPSVSSIAGYVDSAMNGNVSVYVTGANVVKCYPGARNVFGGPTFDVPMGGPGFSTQCFKPANGIQETFRVNLHVMDCTHMSIPSFECEYTDTYFNLVVGSAVAPPTPTPTPTPAALVPQTGLWWNPSESGSGYSIDVKNGTLVMLVFSYKTNGDSEWYIASGVLTNGGKSFTGTLDKARNGQCISCIYPGAPTFVGSDGTVTVEFSSATAARMTLPGGRQLNIQPQPF
jgi:hypothetical protein